MTTTEKTYSLEQATLITGYSKNRFRYNRELLIENGVVVTDDGWKIPHTALVALGWIGVKSPKTPLKPLTPAQQRRVTNEVETLRARVHELENELAIANSRKGLLSRITGR